jgi:hypothetical protein
MLLKSTSLYLRGRLLELGQGTSGNSDSGNGACEGSRRPSQFTGAEFDFLSGSYDGRRVIMLARSLRAMVMRSVAGEVGRPN